MRSFESVGSATIDLVSHSPEPEETLGVRSVHAVFDWLEYAGDRMRTLELLGGFRSWLATEATVAGGIGPAETDRLWRRHIADSLTFMAGLGRPAAIVDVGSGVGLPGIPLAIALPEVEFSLLDRSERRCDLANRAIRVLELPNVEVIQGDARTLRLPHDAAVSRAFAAPLEIVGTLRKLLPIGTHAVLGGSHRGTPPVEEGRFEIIRVPDHVLGEAAWLAKVSLLKQPWLCSRP
jgi:16S rRNA (guanine527-N7)-methyltransferase